MRKIKIVEWDTKKPVIKDGKQTGEFEDSKENTIDMIKIVLNNTRPEEMPRGLEKFRTFNKLNESFDKAKTTKVLTLEEAEYVFVKIILEKNVPAQWGMNKDITKALLEFMETEEVKDDAKG